MNSIKWNGELEPFFGNKYTISWQAGFQDNSVRTKWGTKLKKLSSIRHNNAYNTQNNLTETSPW